MTQTTIQLNPNGHYHDQADDRLADYEELDTYTYTELALPALTSTIGGTLFNGDTYKVVTVAGITYGVGYKMIDGLMVAWTLLSPYMIVENEKRGMH